MAAVGEEELSKRRVAEAGVDGQRTRVIVAWYFWSASCAPYIQVERSPEATI